MILSAIEDHRLFWRQHPALLFALTLLIGTSTALFWQNPWNCIFPFLWSCYLICLKKHPLLLLLFGGISYCYFLFYTPPESGNTTGIFAISTLQPHQSPFAKGSIYKGTLHTKESTIPCDIYTHGQHPPQSADRDYFVAGKLDKRGLFQYAFKPEKWIPIEKSWSFAKWRYFLKKQYRRFLSEECHDYPQAAEFLAALTTGDLEDRLLKYQFGRLGLQHLLAISGFHFGILLAFASFVLSLFVSRFWKLLTLLLCLTMYYVFIGPFPAVQRSWITAITYLIGKLLNRQTSGLNLLGVALGFEIILDPLIASNLGFQFSFTSCAGILLFHPFFEKKLRPLLPKRTSDELFAFSFLSKHVYLVSNFLRHSMALNFAVNITIFPLLLFHFHLFPPLSLIYNLFFPFCVGIALCSLLLALMLYCLVPSFGSFLLDKTAWFITQLLDIAAYPPSALDYPILFSHFPVWALPLSLFALVSISISNSTSK